MQQATCNLYPTIKEALVGLLDDVLPDPARIASQVADLAQEFGDEVYVELLYLLCHLSFAPDEARSHWQKILEHQQQLTVQRTQDVDLRVALLDYFVSVNKQFHNPKIIEIQIFQKTLDSAMRDEMTGLYNYRFVCCALERESARAAREKSSLAVALFDVDHFKFYNDRNGHLRGDEALRLVAKIMQEQVRATDVVGRYGGEEFVVLFPGTKKAAALQVAERIRERIASYDFPFGEGQPGGKFSVSGGVASYGAEAETSMELLDTADQALYQAKATGWNRVAVAGSEYRDYPRIAAIVPGHIRTVAPESQSILTEDISEQGLQFRFDADIEPGTLFCVSLQLPADGKEVEAIARVVRVERDGESALIGAEFVEIGYEHAQALKKYLARIEAPATA